MADEPNQQQAPATEAPAEGAKDGFGAAFAEAVEGTPKTQPDGAEPSTKEPAEAGSEQAPATEAATDATTSGTATPDPLAELTPEQLRQRLADAEAERDRARASDRSNRGRVGALTKKLNNLERTPAPAAAPKAEEGEQPSSAKGTDLDAQYAKAIEEFPEVVGPLAERQKQLEAEMARLKGFADLVEVNTDAEQLAQALDDLEKVHPDFREYNEGNAGFMAWLGEQPEPFQQAAGSTDPASVAKVLTLYKVERSAAPATPSGEGSDPGSQEGSATDDKRARQLDGNRQVPARGAPVVAGVPNEFSSAWKARAAAPPP